MNSGVGDATQFLKVIKSFEASIIPYNPLKDREQSLFARVLGSHLERVPKTYRNVIEQFATSYGKYFSRDIFNIAFDFLEKNQGYAKTIFSLEKLENISFARLKLDFLAEQMAYGDSNGYYDKKIRIELRDTLVYVKLYEEVADSFLTPFVLILGETSQKKPKPDYTKLKVRNKIEIIGSGCLDSLSRNCNPTVRNAISHGGITYEFFGIVFRDDKGNEERFSESTFRSLVISLIDDLYGIALALELFFTCKIYPQTEDQLHTLPLSLKKRIIFNTLSNLDYKLLDVESAPMDKNGKQLNVECYFSNATFERTLAMALRVLDLISIYFPEYERLFVSIHSEKMLPGWIRFNVKNFLRWKTGQISFNDFFREAGSDTLLWMQPRSDVFSRYWRIVNHSLKALKHIAIPQAIEKFNKQVDPYYDMYYICNFEPKSIKGAKRVKADIVVIQYPIQTEYLIGIVLSATKHVRKRKTDKDITIPTKYGRAKADYVWLKIYSDAVRVDKAGNTAKVLGVSEFFSGIKGFDWVFIKQNFEQVTTNLRIQIVDQLKYR